MDRIISSNGISKSKHKIDSVLNFPGTHDFLGLANYFRNLVPFHSDIVAPLQRIDPNGRKASIIWTNEAQRAYYHIRQVIANCPSLHFMDEESPVE